jgi:hypothetical protein
VYWIMSKLVIPILMQIRDTVSPWIGRLQVRYPDRDQQRRAKARMLRMLEEDV